MRIEHLYFLIVIQQSSSLSEAAQKLHISVQALSRSISNMENELGYKILDRTYKGVSLTSKGRALVDISQRFLTELSNLNKSDEDFPPILEGQYSLYSISGEVNYFYLHLLTYLQKKFPNLDLQIEHHQIDSLIELLLSKQIDFGMCCDTKVSGVVVSDFPNELVFTPLLPCKLYALVPAHSSLAIYNSISIKSILSYPLLFQKTREKGSPHMLDLIHFFGEPKDIIIKSSISYLQQLVAADVGIYLQMILTNNPPQNLNHENIKILPIRDDIKIMFGYLSRKSTDFSFPETEPLLSYIHAEAEKIR